MSRAIGKSYRSRLCSAVMEWIRRFIEQTRGNANCSICLRVDPNGTNQGVFALAPVSRCQSIPPVQRSAARWPEGRRTGRELVRRSVRLIQLCSVLHVQCVRVDGLLAEESDVTSVGGTGPKHCAYKIYLRGTRNAMPVRNDVLSCFTDDFNRAVPTEESALPIPPLKETRAYRNRTA